MKKLSILLVLSLMVLACAKRPEVYATTGELATIQPTPATSTPTETSVVEAPTASLTVETPIQDIGNILFTGYWMKVVKAPDEFGSWRMDLYYQDGYNLTLITYFCVRGSDNNTPNGFYFIAVDRPTMYPNAVGGYSETMFSHNLLFKFSELGNWYFHSAPWNTEGYQGCPTRNTGGCVNMRDQDFRVLIYGDAYTNPYTGETIDLPEITVGAPVVIVDSDDSCTYLGQCMDLFQCKSGMTCFKYYTCATCDNDFESRWKKMSDLAPNLWSLEK